LLLIVALNLRDHSAIVGWCHAGGVSLVIVGPEDPLADGIADSLIKEGRLSHNFKIVFKTSKVID